MMNRSHSRVAARVFGYTFSALFAVSGACAPGVPTNPGEPVDTQVGSVAVTPTAPSLQVGGATQLSAVARTVDGAVVTGATAAWSSSNHAVATVSATGLVSALSPGTADISATVSGVVGHATLTTFNPAAVLQQVGLSPSTVSLTTGATQQFSPSFHWSDGSTGAAPVAFTATGGNISTSGLYTAGSTAGNFQVSVREPQTGLTAAATVVITAPAPPPTLQQVSLSPASVTLTTGASAQFTVSFRWSNGSTAATPVTFTATGGSISTSGLYTAGGSAGNFQVSVREPQTGLTAAASVVVTAPAPPPPPPPGSSEPRPGPNSTILFQDDFERYDGTCHSLTAIGGWATSDDYCGVPGSSTITTPDGVGSLGTATGIGGRAARWIWPVSTSEQFFIAEHAVSGFSGRNPEYFTYDYRAPNFVYYGAPPRLGKKMFLLLIGGNQSARVTINPAEWGLQQSNGVHLNPDFDHWPAGLTTRDQFLAYLTNGNWHRYTIMRLPETVNGAMDGQIRIWVDGYLVVDYQHAGTYTGNTNTLDLAGTFNGGSSKVQTEYYDNVFAWR